MNMRKLSSLLLFRSAGAALLVALASSTGAQTLARPGWVGSGMTAAPWWKRPVIYRADPRGFGGLHGLAGHMDYVHSLGVDALLLTSLSTADAKQPIDPALGTMDDFEEIIRNASQFNIRVLTEIDARTTDLNSAARLWLVHGAAGFYAPGASAQQLADLKRASGGFAGQRIVIGDLTNLSSPDQHSADLPMLVTDAAATQEKLSASTIRPALESAQQLADQGRTTPLLFSDGPGLKRSLGRLGSGSASEAAAKTIAAMLLTTRAASILYWGQELGLADSTAAITFGEPKKGEQPAPGTEAEGNASSSSLLNWYRQLIALSHSNRTISSGAITVLNHDDQNVLAWVRRPQSASSATPPIVVVENLSDKPVTLSLKEDVQKLHLRGSFLRTVLRTDDAMGAMHLDGMTLQPYQVFIGELRY
ncbi:MAG: alpha-amylase family glycosyl hydrolase [Edaphobacter sp.]|uniref:alpha-amylase family glycosyl hydrolase n=1 Tax=Edaphobacter sp. TaxID=1934404 RepID=UPI002388F165|nr:alpha-amylase family glycosyl hydrolase [Edaphobacter sp.]MDE1177025.1 alpha-amylase family glycosyl hydrolase [Edaphobacter sp.]